MIVGPVRPQAHYLSLLIFEQQKFVSLPRQLLHCTPSKLHLPEFCYISCAHLLRSQMQANDVASQLSERFTQLQILHCHPTVRSPAYGSLHQLPNLRHSSTNQQQPTDTLQRPQCQAWQPFPCGNHHQPQLKARPRPTYVSRPHSQLTMRGIQMLQLDSYRH